jgi:ATP-dependent exoDNAse (exonuclease V) beta subunit
VLTQHYAMLQRNLLYTGVTRAKKLVVLIGQKKAAQRLGPSTLVETRRVAARATNRFSNGLRWMTATQSGCYPLGATVSMRQKDLTPLDLIARETRRGLAMWTDDRRLARDCYAEVWTVTRIDGFLECDKSLAL